MTCIFSALFTTTVSRPTGYLTQISSTSSNDDIFSSSSYPLVLTSLLDFITMTLLFGYCKTTFNVHLQEVGVTLLHLIMNEVSFFSLGYSALPSLFCCDGPPLVLAFQLGFQGFEGLNG